MMDVCAMSATMKKLKAPKNTITNNTASRHYTEQIHAHAMNYKVPTVDQFLVLTKNTDYVEAQFNDTAAMMDDQGSVYDPTSLEDDTTARDESVAALTMGEEANGYENHLSSRKSRRSRKPRTTHFEKQRIRYDMNRVPPVHKNRVFLEMWRRSSRFSSDPRSETTDENLPSTEYDPRIHGSPFGDDSVLWVPAGRTEWEDCLSEMTAVCTTAALRRHATTEGRTTNKPFYAPLSRDYIRDRVDIDDPLNGFQIRHVSGGWLQGFIMYTNYTVWSHFFKWDSIHPKSGVQSKPESIPECRVDADGSLAAELESQPRSGDPLEGGVVFPTIAEIGLLGGLGCGEFLLRMVLDIMVQRKQYKYVALQATDASRTFYERFGFIRVGAISRYGPPSHSARMMVETESETNLSEEVGYRHWTYAHETERSLGKHGGPSYMMALRLYPDGLDSNQPREQRCLFDFTKAMREVVVTERPTISSLINGSSLASRKKTFTFVPPPLVEPTKTPSVGRPKQKAAPTERTSGTKSSSRSSSRKRRSNAITTTATTTTAPQEEPSDQPETPAPPVPPSQPAPPLATVISEEEPGNSSPKQPPLLEQRERLMTPPPPGKNLTYHQKQYQSVWLAVPPKENSSSERRPPRARPPVHGPVTKKRKLPRGNELDQMNAADDAPDDGIPILAEDILREEASAPTEDTPALGEDGPSAAEDVPVPPDDAPEDAAPMPPDDALTKADDTLVPLETLAPADDAPVLAEDVFAPPDGALASADDPFALVDEQEDDPFVLVDESTDDPFALVDDTPAPADDPFASMEDVPTPADDTPVPGDGMDAVEDVATEGKVKIKATQPGDGFGNIPDVNDSAAKEKGQKKKEKKRRKKRKEPERESSPDEEAARLDRQNNLADEVLESRKAASPNAVTTPYLRKQKILSIPRTIPKEQQFYNKVVVVDGDKPKQYFFVLHFDPDETMMPVIALEIRGELTGKRKGRPRWKAVLDQKRVVSVSDCRIAKAAMVTKTPNVACETWDILE